MALEHLPGNDLVAAGLRDLALGIESEAALLVSIGEPRLARLGFVIARVRALAIQRTDPSTRKLRTCRRMRTPINRERVAALIERLATGQKRPE